jgi:hypothetical protein
LDQGVEHSRDLIALIHQKRPPLGINCSNFDGYPSLGRELGCRPFRYEEKPTGFSVRIAFITFSDVAWNAYRASTHLVPQSPVSAD